MASNSKKTRWLWFLKKQEIPDLDGSLYLTRYYILKTKWFGIYLHKIHKSDADRALHDHPWRFTSMILKSGYIEYFPEGRTQRRGFLSLGVRPAEALHRVQLFTDKTGKVIPAWTLVFVTGKQREWGFMTDEGWVHNEDFIKARYTGNKEAPVTNQAPQPPEQA